VTHLKGGGKREAFLGPQDAGMTQVGDE
jgi:hypothetical protein